MQKIALLAACLLILAACAAQGDGNPTPRVVHVFKWEDDYEGAATASVEERIWHADVIVRATLQTKSTGTLNFRVLEYLKGSGPSVITVSAETDGLPTTWDRQEAVLFLKRDATRSTAFEFADTTEWNWASPQTYTGNLPEGYTVDSRNPVWVPVASQTQTKSASVPAGESL